MSEETKAYVWYGDLLSKTERQLADFFSVPLEKLFTNQEPADWCQRGRLIANSLLMLKGQHALCSMPGWIVPRNRIEPIDRDAVTVVDVRIKEAS